VIDRVETALGKDLTSFALSRPAELGPEDFAPRRLPAILPQLRNAGASRILTLDALEAPGVTLRATAASGLPGLTLRLYAVEDAAPRAFVACRAVGTAGAGEALHAALAGGLDASREVALETPAAAACGGGAVRRVVDRPTRQVYEVELDGPGLLVTRDAWARGWRAAVDGREAPVLRANGKHRAVPLEAGRHRVQLDYRAPNLRRGIAVCALALGIVGALLVRRRPQPGSMA